MFDEGRMKVAIDVAATGFGRFDLFVKNAGISDRSIPNCHAVETERGRVLVVNVKSMFFDTKHAIINLLSAAGQIGIGCIAFDHPSTVAVR
jgi:NAD(P)-dependent dehydrogenase (short-subunit alcohol dehydrogenase family)